MDDKDKIFLINLMEGIENEALRKKLKRKKLFKTCKSVKHILFIIFVCLLQLSQDIGNISRNRERIYSVHEHYPGPIRTVHSLVQLHGTG